MREGAVIGRECILGKGSYVDKNVKIVATFPESTHPPIIYPIAILASSTNGVAPVYVQYLLSPKAEPFFEKQGFVEFFEYEVYRKDGTKIWLCENARAVRNANGVVMYYEGTVEDITEHKLVDEVKRASKAKTLLRT